MYYLRLVRNYSNYCTSGPLFLVNKLSDKAETLQFLCFTLELPQKSLTSLLEPGHYNLRVNYSPRFKCQLPLLSSEYIPESRGFRIHAGNTIEDTKGCILVGDSLYRAHSSHFNTAYFCELYNSRVALNKLMKAIRTYSITSIDIV